MILLDFPIRISIYFNENVIYTRYIRVLARFLFVKRCFNKILLLCNNDSYKTLNNTVTNLTVMVPVAIILQYFNLSYQLILYIVLQDINLFFLHIFCSDECNIRLWPEL